MLGSADGRRPHPRRRPRPVFVPRPGRDAAVGRGGGPPARPEVPPRRAAARQDLSVIQMRLLGILRDREPGTLLLSRILELDKSSVTGLVDRAEKRGLVERVPDPDDGRAVRIKLTRVGRAVVTAGAAELEAEIETVAAGLTD